MTAEAAAGESLDEDLRRIWEAHVSPGGDDTGFLDRGGHSLAAVRVSAAVGAHFGVALPLAALMRDNLSLVRLREHVAGARLDRPAPGTPEPDRGRPARRVQPLTSAQRAVWTDEQLKDGSGSYAVVGALRVEAALDRGQLTAAVRRVVARHEALTARRELFASGPALVMARIPGRGGAAATDGRDVVEPGGPDLESTAARLVLGLGDDDKPPIRVALMHEDDHDIVVIAVDHLMADAESLDVVFADLAAAYDDPATPDGRAPSYAAFLDRQRAFEQTCRDAAVARWRRVGGAGLPLPLEACAPALGGPAPRVHADLDADRTVQVRKALRDRHVTLAAALVAAVAGVVGRGQGVEETLVGVPVSQRRTAEDLGVVGMALGVLPLPLPVGGDTDARLAAAREGLLTGREHASVGLGELVRGSGGALDPRHLPVRVWVNDLTGRRPPPRFGGAPTCYVDDLVAPAPFPLNVYLSNVEGGLRVTLTQDAEIFVDPDFATALAGQVLDELEALAFTPRRRADEVVEPALESRDLKTGFPEDRQAGLHPLQILRGTPGPGRVVDGESALNRDGLWREVDALTARIAEAGLPAGAAVLVEAERSTHLLVGLLALWQAGLVPAVVDAALPVQERDRRAHAAGVLGRLVGTPSVLRTLPAVAEAHSAVALGPPGHLAPGHVLFTSGTTGAPQAVPMRLSALVGALSDLVAAAGHTSKDRLGFTSGLGHDPMFRDLLVPLVTGAELYVPDPEAMRDPARLFRFVADSRLTVLHATPSLLRLLLAGAAGANLDHLRLVVSGGETLTRALLDELRTTAPGVRVLNAYGCTESAQVAALLDLSNVPTASTLPIGPGCGASRVHVVVDGRAAAPGELGEVVIAGPWISPGDGSRATLPSGDLGRADTRGRVHLQGRRDRQLSIAGHRVEPERIEAEARRVVGVDQAWVGPDASAPDTLVLAVTGKGGVDLTGELRRRLGAVLAPHERPSRIVLVHDFALDDHQKRVGPGRPVRTERARPAGRAGEQRLTALVEREVGIALDPTTNFFDGGLTSLQLLHLRGVLQDELGRPLPPTALFEHSNVRALAAHLDRVDRPAPSRLRRATADREHTAARGTTPERRSRARQRLYDDEGTR